MSNGESALRVDPRGRCFLAYRSTHQDQIFRLADALDLVGVPIWLDLREQPSGPILTEVEEVLRDRSTSAAVVWLCSTTREASKIHREEMRLAIRRALDAPERGPRFRTHVFVTGLSRVFGPDGRPSARLMPA